MRQVTNAVVVKVNEIGRRGEQESRKRWKPLLRNRQLYRIHWSCTWMERSLERPFEYRFGHGARKRNEQGARRTTGSRHGAMKDGVRAYIMSGTDRINTFLFLHFFFVRFVVVVKPKHAVTTDCTYRLEMWRNDKHMSHLLFIRSSSLF